jgi:hypothetical protein
MVRFLGGRINGTLTLCIENKEWFYFSVITMLYYACMYIQHLSEHNYEEINKYGTK